MVLHGQQEKTLDNGFVLRCHPRANTRQHLFVTVKYTLLPIMEILGLQEPIADHGMAFQYRPPDNIKQQLLTAVTIYGHHQTMV